MSFNITAILAATIVSYILGSLWYLWLGRSWRSAVGWSEQGPAYRPTPFELLVGLAGQWVMALALSVLLAQIGGAGLRIGLIAASGIWLGFVVPSLATNVIFQRRSRTLIWQDGLHWLLVLASQGAMLGLLS
jgi:hypothetical protein